MPVLEEKNKQGKPKQTNKAKPLNWCRKVNISHVEYVDNFLSNKPFSLFMPQKRGKKEL